MIYRICRGADVVVGTCESMAQEFATELSGVMDVQVLPLDAVADSRLVGFPSAVIITSTYNGCPPSNSKRFDDWISKQTASGLLKRTNFALFGVGSSSWRTFHAFAKKVYKRLTELGAKPLTEYAGGDVNRNCKDTFTAWKRKVIILISGGIPTLESSPKSSIVIEGMLLVLT